MKKTLLFLLTLIMAVSAGAVDYVLTGGFNGWAENDATYKFTNKGDGTYTLTMDKLPSGFKIKSAESGWNDSYNYGSNGTDKLVLGQTLNLVNGSSSQNIVTSDGNPIANVTLTFNPSAKTLKAEGQMSTAETTYVLHGCFESSTWADVELTKNSSSWEASDVTVSFTSAKFGIKKCLDGVQTEWIASPTNVTISATGTYNCANSNTQNFGIAAGKYDFSYNPDTKKLTVTKKADVTPEPDPDPTPAKVYLMGIGGDWATGIGEEVYETSHCATFTITKWVAGTEFKFKYEDVWYGYTGTVENGEWYKTGDTGTENTKLPESANDKEVTIVFATDNQNFSASWEEDVTPEPEPEFYVIGTILGLEGAENWTVEKAVKMAEAENVFTYTAEATAAGAEFKILSADKNLSASYGAEGNGSAALTLEVGVAANAAISSRNFKIAKAMTDVTITFTYVKDGTSTVKLTGTEKEDVTPEPDPTTTVALMTSANEFAEPVLSTTEITDNCATLVVAEWAEGTTFKFKVNDTWYGHNDANAPIKNNEWYSAVMEGGMDNNFVLPTSANGKKVTFTVAVDNGNFKAAWEEDVTPEPEPTDWYLAGEFNNWNPADNNYKFTCEGNTYTISLPALNGEFKIFGGSYEKSFGADAGGQAVDYVDGIIGDNTMWSGSSVNLYATEWTDVKLTFTYEDDQNPITLHISAKTSGLNAAIIEIEQGVEYYNLQGVRVKNPSHGQMYIRVQGTNVSKVVL